MIPEGDNLLLSDLKEIWVSYEFFVNYLVRGNE